MGHLENPDLTVTLDYVTAKAILVDGNPQAGMQAFMAGKIKVQGDMTKMMAHAVRAPRIRPRPRSPPRSRRSPPTERGSRRPALAPDLVRGRPAGRPRRVGRLDRTKQRAHQAERRPRRRPPGRPRRRPPPRRPTAARTTDTVCITWMPITTPSCVIICWKAPATPRSRSSTALAMLAGERRRRAAEPDARTAPATPTITRSDDAGRDRRQRDHRRHHEGRRRRRPSVRSPTSHGDVAGQRAGDREGERPGDHQAADRGLRVVEHRLEEDRGDDEAAHVGEVREELGGDGEGEVAPPHVGQRQQRVLDAPLDAARRRRWPAARRRSRRRSAGLDQPQQRPAVDGEQQRRGPDRERRRRP